jgi:PAS domain S-box-containing protein
MQDVDVWLVDRLVVPASLHDVEGRFVHMNAAAEQASGYTNAQLRGRHVTYLLLPEARESVEAQFRRAVDSAEPTDFETLFVDAAGDLRGTRAQYLPLQEDGAVIGVLILAFDVLRRPSEPVRINPDARLTPRQREILGLIASGLSTEEVAKELTLSPETVRNHLRNASKELRAHTRVEAIATAQRLGLLAPAALRPHAPSTGRQPDARA